MGVLAPFSVKHEKNGFLVERGEIGALSRSIITLLKNKKLAEKFGEEGKKIVLKYTWKKTARKTKKIYEDFLS